MARTRGYQRYRRITKRLEVTFSAGGIRYKGILSNLSTNGLFIRTNRGFTPGTVVDIQIIMPGNQVASLTGVVKRTIKVPVTPARNGMGIELITSDEIFLDYVRNVLREQGIEMKEATSSEHVPEYEIIACNGCGVKNKVSREKLSGDPQCGRCGRLLITEIP